MQVKQALTRQGRTGYNMVRPYLLPEIVRRLEKAADKEIARLAKQLGGNKMLIAEELSLQEPDTITIVEKRSKVRLSTSRNYHREEALGQYLWNLVDRRWERYCNTH